MREEVDVGVVPQAFEDTSSEGLGEVVLEYIVDASLRIGNHDRAGVFEVMCGLQTSQKSAAEH